jgi:transposase
LLSAVVHSAGIQDRDGVALVLDKRTRALFPFILRIFADAGYQGPRAAMAAAASGSWVIEIVKRNELHAFVVLPKRWIPGSSPRTSRTIAWLNRCRRLAKDWENLNRKALAFMRLASIRLMLRKLCNPV